MQKTKKELRLLNLEGTIFDQNLFPHKHVPKEQLYKIIAEFSIDWIYWLNPHNKIVYMSPSCKYTTGYTHEEFTENQNLLIKIIAHEDLEKFINHTREVFKGKIFCNEEFRIITKSGEERWIAHACQAVYDDNNKYIGRYVSNRDITELKKAWFNLEIKDNMIMNIYKDAELGNYQIYPDGTFKFANNVLVKMLGYNTFEEIYNINFDEKVILNREKRSWFKKIVKIKGFVKDFESEWLKKDGTIIYVKENIRAVKDSNNNVRYYEGIVQNITDKKIVEESLIEAEEKKKKLEKLKAEFLATISHEIRTPVNIIVNLSQMLKADLDNTINDELIENAIIIENESKRIQRTIDLILEIAQLSADAYEYNPETLNLFNDVLKEIYGKYKTLVESKGLTFTLISNASNPVLIADRHSCLQIFNQLTENAIKYTPEGRIEIVMNNSPKGELVVDVVDSGIGIDEKYIPYLFTIFSQEDNSYSRMFEGTGLGLAIVKKHCELNSARIEVFSKKGEGSTFRVIFEKPVF